MSGARLVRATGSLVAVGAAVYAGQSYYEVWSAESECRALQNQSAEHGRVIEQSQSSILEQEKRAERLFAERGKQQQAVSKAESDVSEAQKRLIQLEEQKQELDKQLQETQKELLEGKQKTDKLVEEIKHRIEARTMADKAFAAAQQHAAEVRKNANPLQHPLVRDYFGGR